MNEFLWNIFEIAVNFLEAFIMFYFICGFLKHDFKTPQGKGVFVIGSVLKAVMTTFMNHITLYDWWVGCIGILELFVISCIFLKADIMTKLIASAITEVVSMVSGNFVTAVLSVALSTAPEELFGMQSAYRILGVLMCQTINVFLYSLILKFVDKTILAMKKKEWILIVSVFLISVLSFGVIQTAINETTLSEETTLMLMVCEIGLFALNIICLYIIISLNKSNRAAEELKLKEQQLKNDIQYAETVRSQYQEIRRIRHDIKQQLATVSGLQFERKYDKAQKYISEVTDSIEQLDMFMDVGNDFVNAILNSKLSIAKSKGIEVLCNFSGKVEGINEYDLCNLMGNVLDNAIEAAERSGDNAIVEVSLFSDKHKLVFTVSNSISKSVLNSNPKLKTVKEKPELHGFGVQTIKTIADKYDGNVDFYEEDLVFFCHVLLCKQYQTN